tara:strand:- start:279 stop:473 length:195 start_codon:yes stop_codon:yes gene_type:complete
MTTYHSDGSVTNTITENQEKKKRDLAKAENQMIPPELRPAFSEKEKNRKYLENMKKLRDRGKLG